MSDPNPGKGRSPLEFPDWSGKLERRSTETVDAMHERSTENLPVGDLRRKRNRMRLEEKISKEFKL